MFIQEQVTTEEQIKKLGSALTWEGLKVDEENIDAMFNWIEESTPVLQRKIYVISGELMNRLYNAGYPDNLNIVCVDLNDLEDFSKIVLRRFSVGARWLDDIISNLRYNINNSDNNYDEDDNDNNYDDSDSDDYYEDGTEKPYQKEYNGIMYKY